VRWGRGRKTNDFASLTKRKEALTPRALCTINIPLTQLFTGKMHILICSNCARHGGAEAAGMLKGSVSVTWARR